MKLKIVAFETFPVFLKLIEEVKTDSYKKYYNAYQ